MNNINLVMVLMTYHLSLWLFDRVPQLLLVSQQNDTSISQNIKNTERQSKYFATVTATDINKKTFSNNWQHCQNIYTQNACD